jgi:hypothetical protein
MEEFSNGEIDESPTHGGFIQLTAFSDAIAITNEK